MLTKIGFFRLVFYPVILLFFVVAKILHLCVYLLDPTYDAEAAAVAFKVDLRLDI